jgi:hypothetical protein
MLGYIGSWLLCTWWRHSLGCNPNVHTFFTEVVFLTLSSATTIHSILSFLWDLLNITPPSPRSPRWSLSLISRPKYMLFSSPPCVRYMSRPSQPPTNTLSPSANHHSNIMWRAHIAKVLFHVAKSQHVDMWAPPALCHAVHKSLLRDGLLPVGRGYEFWPCEEKVQS